MIPYYDIRKIKQQLAQFIPPPVPIMPVVERVEKKWVYDPQQQKYVIPSKVGRKPKPQPQQQFFERLVVLLPPDEQDYQPLLIEKVLASTSDVGKFATMVGNTLRRVYSTEGTLTPERIEDILPFIDTSPLKQLDMKEQFQQLESDIDLPFMREVKETIEQFGKTEAAAAQAAAEQGVDVDDFERETLWERYIEWVQTTDEYEFTFRLKPKERIDFEEDLIVWKSKDYVVSLMEVMDIVEGEYIELPKQGYYGLLENLPFDNQGRYIGKIEEYIRLNRLRYWSRYILENSTSSDEINDVIDEIEGIIKELDFNWDSFSYVDEWNVDKEYSERATHYQQFLRIYLPDYMWHEIFQNVPSLR